MGTSRGIKGKRFSELSPRQQAAVRAAAKQSFTLDKMIDEDEPLTRETFLIWNGVPQNIFRFDGEFESDAVPEFLWPTPKEQKELTALAEGLEADEEGHDG